MSNSLVNKQESHIVTENKIGKVCNSKVKYIRPIYNDLKEVIENSSNIYIGRRGIVFVDKQRYPETNSVWHNPYKVGKDGDLQKVLEMYVSYIKNKINKKEVNIAELIGKNMYCWCVEKDTYYNKDDKIMCHGQILQQLLSEYLKINNQLDFQLENLFSKKTIND